MPVGATASSAGQSESWVLVLALSTWWGLEPGVPGALLVDDSSKTGFETFPCVTVQVGQVSVELSSSCALQEWQDPAAVLCPSGPMATWDGLSLTVAQAWPRYRCVTIGYSMAVFSPTQVTKPQNNNDWHTGNLGWLTGSWLSHPYHGTFTRVCGALRNYQSRNFEEIG